MSCFNGGVADRKHAAKPVRQDFSSLEVSGNQTLKHEVE